MSLTFEQDSVPARSDNVLATQAQDVAVLMSMDTGKFVELNETAQAVWDLTDGSRSVADVIGALTEAFDVTSEQCSQSVTGLYGKLAEEGLVTFSA